MLASILVVAFISVISPILVVLVSLPTFLATAKPFYVYLRATATTTAASPFGGKFPIFRTIGVKFAQDWLIQIVAQL